MWKLRLRYLWLNIRYYSNMSVWVMMMIIYMVIEERVRGWMSERMEEEYKKWNMLIWMIWIVLCMMMMKRVTKKYEESYNKIDGEMREIRNERNRERYLAEVEEERRIEMMRVEVREIGKMEKTIRFLIMIPLTMIYIAIRIIGICIKMNEGNGEGEDGEFVGDVDEQRRIDRRYEAEREGRRERDMEEQRLFNRGYRVQSDGVWRQSSEGTW